MQVKRTVVIGFLGTQLDNGRGAARWEKWRPSVALTQHEDKIIDRFELLYAGEQFASLVRQVSQDIASVSPETRLIAYSTQTGHLFRRKLDSRSIANWTPVPGQTGHLGRNGAGLRLCFTLDGPSLSN